LKLHRINECILDDKKHLITMHTPAIRLLGLHDLHGVSGAASLARLASATVLDASLVDGDIFIQDAIDPGRAVINAFMATCHRGTLARVDLNLEGLPLDGARHLDRVVGANVRAREAARAFPVVDPPVPPLDHDGVVPASVVATTAQVA
jgi:hypothetical protein